MKDSLTPEAIVSDFLNGTLNLTLALNLLMSILEKSDNPELRRNSILALKKINANNEKIFKILESCLLSDENPYVRSAAANLIGDTFLKYGVNTLRWSIQNDKSPLVIKTIINMFENEDHPEFKLISKEVYNWIKNFSTKIGVVPEESSFFLDLEALFAQDKRTYEISPLTYIYYRKIIRIKDPNPWLIINNKYVEMLNFNYFNWYFLKVNQDMIDSFIDIRDLDAFLDLYKKIDLKKYSTSIIPKSLVNLNSLKKLVLSRNELDKFPEFLTHIKSLEELDLSYNNISEIPESIINLKNLKILNMNHNKIQKIPKGMKSFLNSLQIFNK